MQLALTARARAVAGVKTTPRPLRADGVLAQFDAGLPYKLTGDQSRVGAEFAEELASESPMLRLLQGEVGSGKTLVALRAMLQVADSGGQSALLAPTEVLAAQHLISVTELLGPQLTEQLRPVLITGSMKKAERNSALLQVITGKSKIVIGTHALLSENTDFFDLGLVVIDEQHRFGVEQRDRLRQKGAAPHLLAMTATPIPRTVALTAFGEFEVATLRELPAGRAGIKSFAVQILEQPAAYVRAWQRALEEIAAGRQVYVVCPAIAATDSSSGSAPQQPRASVEEVAATLRARPDFAGVRIGVLTGQLDTLEKERVMRDFAAGRIDLLVATTVIEVGVNVPNASAMLVLEADRFGVSQLHQLRGRIGRGEHPGLCLLMTAAPSSSKSWQRVAAVAQTLDGFELAEIDLEQRREGDILGTAQSGSKATLKLLRVVQDADVILLARRLAQELLDADPQLQAAPLLREQLAKTEQRVQQLQKT